MRLIRFYFFFLLRFLRYYWRAKTRYDIHSPFVYELVDQVVEDQRWFYAFSIIETLRKGLLKNRQTVSIQDYGAGSMVSRKKERTIGGLAQYSAISPRLGRQLFRLTNFIKPKNILELGTSLGISTLYLTGGSPLAKMTTIEGCPATAEWAKTNFRELGMQQIELVVGSFADRLPEILHELASLDLLYQDGDHRPTASYRYFEQCLEKADTNSVFVIADIHWSTAMEAAWEKMVAHPKVTLSIDLFHLGLLFFREEQRVKEHYTIIKSQYKPFHMGFFGRRLS